MDLDAQKTKCAVIKTSTRATYFLPVVGLVEPSELKPGDLVGVNKVRFSCVKIRYAYSLNSVFVKIYSNFIETYPKQFILLLAPEVFIDNIHYAQSHQG